jgi:hypothetical protein
MRALPLAVLLVVLLAVGGVAEAQIRLDSTTKSYLEGQWVLIEQGEARSPCGRRAVDGETYNIVFRRSGGTIHLWDEESEFRVAITRADRLADKSIRLVLGDSDGSHFKDVYIVPISANRIKVRETIGNTSSGPVIALKGVRCSRVAH